MAGSAGAGPDPTKPKAKKAKLIRLEKKQAKAAKLMNVEEPGSSANAHIHEKVQCGFAVLSNMKFK